MEVNLNSAFRKVEPATDLLVRKAPRHHFNDLPLAVCEWLRRPTGSAREGCIDQIRWQPLTACGNTPNTLNKLGEGRVFENNPFSPTRDRG